MDLRKKELVYFSLRSIIQLDLGKCRIGCSISSESKDTCHRHGFFRKWMSQPRASSPAIPRSTQSTRRTLCLMCDSGDHFGLFMQQRNWLRVLNWKERQGEVWEARHSIAFSTGKSILGLLDGSCCSAIQIISNAGEFT